ncbi:MAG: Spy/CpxP family protein refolding chaperone [Gemmatimonadota bacterium]
MSFGVVGASRRFVAITLMLLAGATWPAAAVAQEELPGEDFGRYLYPPELVMRYQRAIGLHEEQRATISDAVTELQRQVVELQWKMSDAKQDLVTMLREPSVEEAEALQGVQRLLDIETAVKRLHLAMLIRIKNTLTPDQQRQLLELRRSGL